MVFPQADLERIVTSLMSFLDSISSDLRGVLSSTVEEGFDESSTSDLDEMEALFLSSFVSISSDLS